MSLSRESEPTDSKITRDKGAVSESPVVVVKADIKPASDARLRAILYLLEEPNREELVPRAIEDIYKSDLFVVCSGQSADNFGVVYFRRVGRSSDQSDDVFFHAYLSREEALRGLAADPQNSIYAIGKINGEVLSQIASECPSSCGLTINYEWNGDWQRVHFSPRAFQGLKRNVIDDISSLFAKQNLGCLTLGLDQMNKAAAKFFPTHPEVLAVAAGVNETTNNVVFIALQKEGVYVDLNIYANVFNQLAAAAIDIGEPKLLIVPEGEAVVREFVREANIRNALIYLRSDLES